MNMNYIPSKKPGDNGYIRDNSNDDIKYSRYKKWLLKDMNFKQDKEK